MEYIYIYIYILLTSNLISLSISTNLLLETGVMLDDKADSFHKASILMCEPNIGFCLLWGHLASAWSIGI